MSKARAKGTAGENFFLARLRIIFGSWVERAPLKGVLDAGDFTGVPWLHESKSTQKPLFQQWARVCEKKSRDWVILWKGDLRVTSGNGPYVLMPMHMYELLIEAHQDIYGAPDEFRNEFQLRKVDL